MSKEIELIKQRVNIVELADGFGAEVYGRGKALSCKHNPLRPDDRKINLKFYPETNTFTDFAGDEKDSSVIDFYMKATGKTFKEAIEDLKTKAGITEETSTYKPKTKYMTLEAVENAFNSPFWENININKDYQKEHLLTVAPEYLFHEASKEDKLEFYNLAKYSKNLGTSIYKLPDIEGNCYTLKYRYKEILDETRKWVSLSNSRADYLYCRYKEEDEYLLIVEGTRDFLNALLCGYSVLAIPRAGFDKVDPNLLQDKKVIFLDDNDNREFMQPLYNKSVCKKIYFNHKKFMQSDCKDFSDYLYKFDSLKEFKNKFDTFIKRQNFEDAGNWQNDLKNSKTLLTLDTLKEIPEVEVLMEKFIFKGTANLIHSNPGQGKTTLLLGILKKLIKTEKIENFIYFDADNPLSVLKDRLPKLADTFKDTMNYHTHTLASVEELLLEMKRLCLFKGQGKNTVVVIDTLGNFVTSVNKDDEVKPIMDLVRELRDAFGATVFLVHHSNKTKDENNRVVFRGSTIIKGVVDFSWGLQRKGNKITMYNDKGRFDYYEKIEAEIDLKDYDLNFEGSNAIDEIEEEYEDTEKDYVSFIKEKDWIRISDVQKHFGMHRTSNKRDEVYNFLKEHRSIELKKEGRGWQCKYFKEFEEPIETIYDDSDLLSILN